MGEAKSATDDTEWHRLGSGSGSSGQFFDVNPGKRRTGPSRLANFVRFSFGPPEENLVAGLSRLSQMVRAVR